jgi:hypothetical protein
MRARVSKTPMAKVAAPMVITEIISAGLRPALKERA